MRTSLTPRDRCDRCGAQAKVRASFLSGDLYFCVHHARQFDVKQSSFSVEVESEEVENMLVLHRFQKGMTMKCIDCETTENLVYSGVAAFVLGVIDLVEKICYDCANKRRRSLTQKESKAVITVAVMSNIENDSAKETPVTIAEIPRNHRTSGNFAGVLDGFGALIT